MAVIRINHEAAREFLAQHDIDASKILADSVTEEGYETFVPHASTGKMRFNGGTPVTEKHSWPKGFDYSEFVKVAGSRPKEEIAEDYEPAEENEPEESFE